MPNDMNPMTWEASATVVIVKSGRPPAPVPATLDMHALGRSALRQAWQNRGSCRRDASASEVASRRVLTR